MKIELKNLKYAAFASHETNCFSANVFIDGVKAGTASNEGYGGPTDVHPESLLKKLNAEAKKRPAVKVEDIAYKMTGCDLIDELVDEALMDRQILKEMKKRVVWVIDGVLHHSIVFKAPVLAQYLVSPNLLKKCGGPKAKVLNLLPPAKQVAEYRKYAEQ